MLQVEWIWAQMPTSIKKIMDCRMLNTVHSGKLISKLESSKTLKCHL